MNPLSALAITVASAFLFLPAASNAATADAAEPVSPLITSAGSYTNFDVVLKLEPSTSNSNTLSVKIGLLVRSGVKAETHMLGGTAPPFVVRPTAWCIITTPNSIWLYDGNERITHYSLGLEESRIFPAVDAQTVRDQAPKEFRVRLPAAVGGFVPSS